MQRLAPGVLAFTSVMGAACGDDGGGTTVDAAADMGPSVRCDPTKPFGPPAYITELATETAEYGARLYDDERTIIFSRRNASNSLNDLFIATRADRDGVFGSAVPLTTVNSASNDAWATQTPDGLTLFYESDRTAGVNQIRPWVTRRTAVADPWGAPVAVPELAVGDARLLVANATSVYFASTARGGAGSSDIFRADVDAAGTLGTPIGIEGTVNSAEEEEAPALTPDELTLFFRRTTTTVDETDPMNPITTVEYDIWSATRGSATEAFGPPAQVETLSVAGVVETPSWISPDGCVLYGTVDGPDGMGAGDLIVAKRPL